MGANGGTNFTSNLIIENNYTLLNIVAPGKWTLMSMNFPLNTGGIPSSQLFDRGLPKGPLPAPRRGYVAFARPYRCSGSGHYLHMGHTRPSWPPCWWIIGGENKKANMNYCRCGAFLEKKVSAEIGYILKG